MKRLVACATAVLALAIALRATTPPVSAMAGEGQQIFRFDTFGDEQLWTRTLRMHEAVRTLSPAAALKAGLKVDNALTAGVGHRLDGWPNRDLNVGGVIALSPALTAEQKKLFNSWGPGKFDPRLQAFDGTTFIPLNSPTLPVRLREVLRQPAGIAPRRSELPPEHGGARDGTDHH